MRAALDLVLLLRFRVFLVSRRSLHDHFLLLKLAGSLWLMLIRTMPSKRNQRLLRLFGADPWEHGWQFLEQGPCLYVIFPFPVRVSVFGPLFYVGETVNFRRRMNEHMLRLLAADGATQQPFYQVVRHGCETGTQLLAALSFLIMLPACVAPTDGGERLLAEASLCHEVGTLNPPRVYSLLPKRKCKPVAGLRIFDSFRPVCRIRSNFLLNKDSSTLVPPSLRLVRKEWRDGLKKTASALAGHKFKNCHAAALAAWNLSPGAWAYVARRVDQSEEGWRRKRGLRLLRTISKKRRDLCPFISSISLSVPWVGSNSAQRVVCRCIRDLLAEWRQLGRWVPVARHAKCFISWSATPTLAGILTDASVLRTALEEGVRPMCNCRQLLLAEPRWPVVTFEGQQHIAASQGHVPWPEHLQHLARWPASLCLPPRYEDIVCAVRHGFRRLRDRCRMHVQDVCTDNAIHVCVSKLWGLLNQDLKVPVTWEQVGDARAWLKSHGFFVSIFDHNSTSLGVFCPLLAFEHACKLLDFGHHQLPEANFVWSNEGIVAQDQVLKCMASIPGLPDHLAPALHSAVAKKLWRIASISLLPKWKCPGLKWRLIVNKHFTPCCGLHSLVSRALDVLLDSFPVHLWSDYLSMGDIMTLVRDFNTMGDLYQMDSGCGVAADMTDCFRHLPIDKFGTMWDALSEFWSSKGVSMVSLPHKRLACRGILGRCDDPGWTCICFDSIRMVLIAFAGTNHVSIGPWLGREQHGAPQGDALSSALLRLWKWYQEYHCKIARTAESTPILETKCKLLFLFDCCVLVLDVSYRDDLRMFFAWRTSSGITPNFVHAWAWTQWRRRFEVGTMCLEEADGNVFTGLQISWNAAAITLQPRMPDPWAAYCYDEVDNFPLKPWQSWGPSNLFRTNVKGLLCRSWYFCNSRLALRAALWEVFVALVFRASYDWQFVRRLALDWALNWTPKYELLPVPTLIDDVRLAISHFEGSLS